MPRHKRDALSQSRGGAFGLQRQRYACCDMHGSIAFRWQRDVLGGLNTTQLAHNPTHASGQESEFTKPG